MAMAGAAAPLESIMTHPLNNTGSADDSYDAGDSYDDNGYGYGACVGGYVNGDNAGARGN